MNDEQMALITRLLTEIRDELRLQRKLIEGRPQVVLPSQPINAVSPQRFLPVSEMDSVPLGQQKTFVGAKFPTKTWEEDLR